ncbi:PREDICTED: uncharacterized protein LOC105367815 [Ceratosolen solmsi marchali]|uniref:aralkylamine N-acetyltransferase n=1 Tax=Ceratosolen solmsi marchali TaxID=326594 RepID=A0AAJ7E207_9HYME|nr:PREDICTED: uncharacterized protein LOC105367815 [Ceratosolen solmsi marchali]
MSSSSAPSSPGETKGLRCTPVPSKRYHDVLEHLKYNFFADEPLNRAIGLCRKGESHQELERHCLFTLAQGISCMIVDEGDKIVGTALNGIVKRGEREECERRLAELQDDKFKSIFGLLYKINEKVDIFAKYDVDELFDCRILSVDETFRGKGLADLLIKNSLKIAKDAGFKVFKADSTGLFSQKAFLKNDFKIITEIRYSDVDERLRPGPPHEALKLLVKILD